MDIGLRHHRVLALRVLSGATAVLCAFGIAAVVSRSTSGGSHVIKASAAAAASTASTASVATDPPTTVVTDQAETAKTKMLHHGELIAGHGSLGIGRGIDLLRTPALPIAPQVCRHNCVVLRQHRREAMPGDMRLRIAVQEQQWRPAPTDKRHGACVFGIDIVPLEPLEHGRGSPSIAWRRQHTPIEPKRSNPLRVQPA